MSTATVFDEYFVPGPSVDENTAITNLWLEFVSIQSANDPSPLEMEPQYSWIPSDAIAPPE